MKIYSATYKKIPCSQEQGMKVIRRRRPIGRPTKALPQREGCKAARAMIGEADNNINYNGNVNSEE